MPYFRSSADDDGEVMFLVRADSLKSAIQVFEVWKKIHAKPAADTLVRVMDYPGRCMFRRLGKKSPNIVVLWKEIKDGETIYHGASRDDLGKMLLEALPENTIRLGGMRNFHPLIGDSRYRMPVYPGWNLAKKHCLPREVLPIFNEYFKHGRVKAELSGETWEEVDASAKKATGGSYESVCVPHIPDFYRLLVSKLDTPLMVMTYSHNDGSGTCYYKTSHVYFPDDFSFHFEELND